MIFEQNFQRRRKATLMMNTGRHADLFILLIYRIGWF